MTDSIGMTIYIIHYTGLQ